MNKDTSKPQRNFFWDKHFNPTALSEEKLPPTHTPPTYLSRVGLPTCSLPPCKTVSAAKERPGWLSLPFSLLGASSFPILFFPEAILSWQFRYLLHPLVEDRWLVHLPLLQAVTQMASGKYGGMMKSGDRCLLQTQHKIFVQCLGKSVQGKCRSLEGLTDLLSYPVSCSYRNAVGEGMHVSIAFLSVHFLSSIRVKAIPG